MQRNFSGFFRIAVVALLLVFMAGTCWAETKLDYRQRQAVQRQEWNMKDVEKKMAAGVSGQQVQWTLKKLDAIIADLDKNNCPDDNSKVASLKERVAKARQTLGAASPVAEPSPAVQPATPMPAAEAKLPYSARQAVERQERNITDIEKKIASGDIYINGKTTWLVNKLTSMVEDLSKNKVPADHSRVKALQGRIETAKASLTGATPAKAVEAASAEQPAAKAKAPAAPKLPPSARQAVNRQWNKVNQNAAVLRKLWDDVEKSTTLKKWNDRNIPFSLQGVQSDLDKNNVPPDHPHYKKIMTFRSKILASVEELKTIAQPKIDAHANATNLDNYPQVQEDIERADELAHLYQNVRVSNLKDPAKAARLLKPLAGIEAFISDSRKKYAPLIENKLGPGNSLETKLKWLEKNFEKFKKVQQDFNQQAPGDIRSMLSRAEGAMSTAVQRKNPQIFTGGVAQSMEGAKGLLESLALSIGQDSPVVSELTQALAATQKKSDETAKALEEEILAGTKAPEEKYEVSGGAALKKKIRDAWKKENPGDEIMDVRIVTADWERNISWDYNAAGVWYKSDKSFLGFIVIVKTDSKIATLYPAFINRDNLKKKESTVTSHKSTYVIRRMLVKNVK